MVAPLTSNKSYPHYNKAKHNYSVIIFKTSTICDQLLYINMSNTDSQLHQQNMDNVPPPGYPTLTPPEEKKKKGWFRTKNRGEKGFIEGCLAALCCCWVCEECCC